MPHSVIEEPERITVEAIERVQSPALRRVMIERYRHGHEIRGVAAYLRDAALGGSTRTPASGRCGAMTSARKRS